MHAKSEGALVCACMHGCTCAVAACKTTMHACTRDRKTMCGGCLTPTVIKQTNKKKTKQQKNKTSRSDANESAAVADSLHDQREHAWCACRSVKRRRVHEGVKWWGGERIDDCNLQTKNQHTQHKKNTQQNIHTKQSQHIRLTEEASIIENDNNAARWGCWWTTDANEERQRAATESQREVDERSNHCFVATYVWRRFDPSAGATQTSQRTTARNASSQWHTHTHTHSQHRRERAARSLT